MKNTLRQGVLIPAIELWVFGSPEGLPSLHFGSVSVILTFLQSGVATYSEGESGSNNSTYSEGEGSSTYSEGERGSYNNTYHKRWGYREKTKGEATKVENECWLPWIA